MTVAEIARRDREGAKRFGRLCEAVDAITFDLLGLPNGFVLTDVQDRALAEFARDNERALARYERIARSAQEIL